LPIVIIGSFFLLMCCFFFFILFSRRNRRRPIRTNNPQIIIQSETTYAQSRGPIQYQMQPSKSQNGPQYRNTFNKN
jgi:hypothetical protein